MSERGYAPESFRYTTMRRIGYFTDRDPLPEYAEALAAVERAEEPKQLAALPLLGLNPDEWQATWTRRYDQWTMPMVVLTLDITRRTEGE